MVKRFFCPILFLVVLLWSTSYSSANEIAVLKSADIRPYNEALEGFRKSCAECILTELTNSERGNPDYSGQIERISPDGVLVIGLDALNSLKNISDLPVVYTMIPGLQPPIPNRKNISGVNMSIQPDKYLSSLLEVFPSAKKVGVIYDPRHSESFVNEAARFAQSRGVELNLRSCSRPGDFPGHLDSMKDNIDVFWMIPDPTAVTSESVKYLLLFSFQKKIPVFTFSKKYVEMGALAGLNIAAYDLGVQAADIMKKVISEKGAKNSIRAEAKRPVLLINSKVAKKIGVNFREDILRKANDVN